MLWAVRRELFVIEAIGDYTPAAASFFYLSVFFL